MPAGRPSKAKKRLKEIYEQLCVLETEVKSLQGVNVDELLALIAKIKAAAQAVPPPGITSDQQAQLKAALLDLGQSFNPPVTE